MAENKTFIVKVKNNPNFCGIGAGGAQFAQGEARIASERLANWFKEHEGYTVTEEGAEKPLNKMTADELKAYAADNNIDISAATNKAEILAIIQNQQ